MSMEIVYKLLQSGLTNREEMIAKSGISSDALTASLCSLKKCGKIEVGGVEVFNSRKRKVYRLPLKKAHIFDRVNSIFNAGDV